MTTNKSEPLKRRISSPWGLHQPIGYEALPVTLKTRVWRPTDPDWEDRPQDPMLCGDVPKPPRQETLDNLDLAEIE